MFENVFRPLIEKGIVEVSVEERASLPNLRERLLEGYHFVHFIGHGMKRGYLLFFLHSQCGIPILTGYHGKISDKKAIEISNLFYNSLLRPGKDLPKSLNSIRLRMDINDPWWRPVFWLPLDPKPLVIKDPAKEAKLAPHFYKELLPLGEDFIYRYYPMRKIGKCLRSKKIRAILLHGPGGTGKSYLASYTARFYRFLFQYVTPLRCNPSLSPRDALQKISLELNLSLNAKDLSSLWEDLLSQLNGNLLLILDDLEEVLDMEGRPISQEWEEFLSLLLDREWNGKALLTSRVNLSLPSWKPAYTPQSLEVIEVGSFLPREVEIYLQFHLSSDLLMSEEFRDFLEMEVGSLPLGLNSLISSVKDYGWNMVKEAPEILLKKIEERLLKRYWDLLTEEDKEGIWKLTVLQGKFPSYYLFREIGESTRKKVERWAYLERISEGKDVYFLMPKVLARYLEGYAPPERIREIALGAARFFEEEGERKKELSLYITAFYLYLKAKKDAKAGEILGSIYPYLHTWGYMEEERKMLKMLLKLKEELGDKAGISASYHQLGNLASGRGAYDEAEGYYKKSLIIKKEIGDIVGTAISKGMLGALYIQGNRLDDSLPLLLDAFHIFFNLKHPQVRSVIPLLLSLRDKMGAEEFEKRTLNIDPGVYRLFQMSVIS